MGDKERALKIAAVIAVCAVTVAGEGLTAYASQPGKIDYGRAYRQGMQDVKVVESRQTGSKAIPPEYLQANIAYLQNQALRRQALQQQLNQQKLVKPTYSTAIHQSSNRNRNTNYKKFRPSPEDPYLRLEQGFLVPSEKYFQKYANQLYTAQKNAAQLSEYQKYILNQDPLVKKFVFAQHQAQAARAPKYLAYAKPEVTTTAPTTKIYPTTITTRSTTTERAPSGTRFNSNSIKPVTEQDNSAQSAGYKYTYTPEIQYVPVYTNEESDSSSSYGDQSQYDQSRFDLSQYDQSHYGEGEDKVVKVPAYQVPASLSLNIGNEGGHAEEEHHEHYPTKEPHYEFKYQVQDHEKNSHFGHAEARKGKTTYGKYYVQLADGRFETVKYWADKTGYHAQVDFKGQARHPPSKPKEHHGLTQGYSLDHSKLYGAHDQNLNDHGFYSIAEPETSGDHE